MENQKTKIISIASLVALIITVIGATYAYFVAQTGEGKSTDIKINANTVDTFTFKTGSAINLNINQDNFASGAGNQTGTTYAKAMLTANNKTNTATEHYYLYLNISENTFTYTQDENTPEILLTIKDASGNAVTSISGLNYKTVKDGKGASISGFDITTKKGLITLFNNREITTTSTKTEQWNVTATFINYDADQSANAGKSFNSKVLIQKEKITLLADYVISQYTGTQGDNSLYYHNSSLTNGAGDNSYRYAGGDYQLTDAGRATGATMIIGYDNTVTTALIDYYCNGTKQYVGYELACSTHYYLVKGNTTQYQTYNEALSASVEKGYLTKDNVKNFVCFGSSTTICPIENLYRIIGVIDGKVKLIKYDYAKSSLLGIDGDFAEEYSNYYFSGNRGESPSSGSLYYWNKTTSANAWSDSSLNKVNLNKNFLNNIGTAWANKIATVTWKVGGNTYDIIVGSVPATTYQYEVGKNSLNTTYDAKIGLMYVSDYYYGAGSSAWTLVGYDGSDATKDYSFLKENNWLYGGEFDWTITRISGDTKFSAIINAAGSVNGSIIYDYGEAIRPVFFIESSIGYVNGDGTINNPIRIE